MGVACIDIRYRLDFFLFSLKKNYMLDIYGFGFSDNCYEKFIFFGSFIIVSYTLLLRSLNTSISFFINKVLVCLLVFPCNVRGHTVNPWCSVFIRMSWLNACRGLSPSFLPRNFQERCEH